MKSKVVLILIVISTALWGQDTEMLGFINQYRITHGKSALTYDAKLAAIAAECNAYNVSNDTLVHTKIAGTMVGGENIVRDTRLPAIAEEKAAFGAFMKSVFGVTYTEPTTDTEVTKMVKMYIIYKYDQSKHHKATLLGNFTKIGFSTTIKGIKKHEAAKPVVIRGKSYARKSSLDYFEVTFYSALDFN